MPGSRSGCQSGTSSGTGGFGRPATTTRIPAGGSGGRSPAILCACTPAVLLRSSSRPSTSNTSRTPWAAQAAAAWPSRSSSHASRNPSSGVDGGSCLVSAPSCSVTAATNAARVSDPASRAVMKNATTCTRDRTASGGSSTNVDNNADLPAHGPACHHTYGPRPGSRQNAASSASSCSRSSKTGGTIRRTCARYADRGVTNGPVADRNTFTVAAVPTPTPPRSPCPSTPAPGIPCHPGSPAGTSPSPGPVSGRTDPAGKGPAPPCAGRRC